MLSDVFALWSIPTAWPTRSLGQMAAPDRAVGEMSLGRMAAPDVTVGEMSLGRMAALDDVLLDLKAGMGSLDCDDHDPMDDLGIETQHAPPQPSQAMDGQTAPQEQVPAPNGASSASGMLPPQEQVPAPNGASSASGMLPPEVDPIDEAQGPSSQPDAGDAPQRVDLKSEAALAARLELPGADSSCSDYSARWDRYRAIFATLNEAEHGAPVMAEVSIIPETARLLGIVTDTYPGWGAYQQSLGVAALYMYNKRLTDLCERDNAHILWIVCGNHLLRAHAGKTYCYNVMYGKWDLFNAVLPNHVFAHLRNFGFILEGIFRDFSGDVERTDAEVLKAMATVFANHPEEKAMVKAMHMNCAWNKGNDKLKLGRGPAKGKGKSAKAPRLAADDIGGVPPSGNLERELEDIMEESQMFGVPAAAAVEEGEPAAAEADGAEVVISSTRSTWYILSSQSIARCIIVLIRRLEVNKSLGFFNEWCQTEYVRASAVAYKDCVVVYDQDGAHVSHKRTRSPWDNIYFGIMRNTITALDPVLNAAIAKLNTAMSQTCWAIPAAFDFQQACQALARRGLNIDCITINWGPGGVGLSRYSAHLEAMYGKENYCTFDANVFFEDGELRKQVLQMVGNMIYTCQEKPQGNRQAMRQDLIKKFATWGGHFWSYALWHRHHAGVPHWLEEDGAQQDAEFRGCD